MTWLSNMTVRMKSIASFTAVIIMFIAFGGFSILQMSSMNDKSLDIRNNWLPSVGAVANLYTLFDYYRIIEGAHIISTSDEGMRAEENTMDEILKSFEKADKTYVAMLTPGYETETYQAFKSAWNSYLNTSKTVLLPTSRKTKPKKPPTFSAVKQENSTGTRKIFCRS